MGFDSHRGFEGILGDGSLSISIEPPPLPLPFVGGFPPPSLPSAEVNVGSQCQQRTRNLRPIHPPTICRLKPPPRPNPPPSRALIASHSPHPQPAVRRAGPGSEDRSCPSGPCRTRRTRTSGARPSSRSARTSGTQTPGGSNQAKWNVLYELYYVRKKIFTNFYANMTQ